MTRADVLDAAETLFLERGYAGTSIAMIAERARYTSGAVYSNFGSKIDLANAVIARRGHALLADWTDVSSRQEASQLLDRIVSDVPMERLSLELMFEAFDDESFHATARDAISGQLDAAARVAEGSGLDPSRAARVVVAMIHGLAVLRLLDPSFDVREPFEDALALLAGSSPGSLR